MRKKVLSVILAIMMMLSVMPAAFAAKTAKPVANCEEVTAAGYDYAVKYSIADKGSEEYYNDWKADIVISADKDVAEGAVTLKGEYGSEKGSAPICALKANEAVSVLGLMGYNVTYWDLVNGVKEFTCGIVNNSLTEDVKFTIKVVLSDGSDSFDVTGSVKVQEVKAPAKPVAKCEEVTADGYDYAVKYSIAQEGSENYNDWDADIVISADKDVAAGAVTLKGEYGSEKGSAPVCAMKAGEEVSVIGLMGYNVTYWDLVNSVKEFTCGVVNESLTEDVTFTIKVVLSKGSESFDVEGSLANQTVVADVMPVAKAERVSVAGYDCAVKLSIAEEGSANYNDWKADIVISADKDVAQGAVTLKGEYGAENGSAPICALKADEEVSVIGLMGYNVTYWDLVNLVKEFTCGVVNEALTEDTNFTIKVVLSNGEETIEVDGSEINVEVASSPETFNVSVTDGTLVSKKFDSAKSNKYEIATVTIAEANGIKGGKWFVYWVDQNGKIVSTYSTYSFFVVENRTLTPVYVSPDEYEAERAKAVIVTDIVRVDDNQNGTITLFAERSASKAAVGDEILQNGIIYTTDASQKDNLTLDNVNVQKASAAKTNNKLCGLLRKTIEVENNDVVYAAAYLVDANGNTTYSDVKTIVVGAFETSGYDLNSLNYATFDSALAQADEIIPTDDNAPADTLSSIFDFVMSILNAVFALINSIIALF